MLAAAALAARRLSDHFVVPPHQTHPDPDILLTEISRPTDPSTVTKRRNPSTTPGCVFDDFATTTTTTTTAVGTPTTTARVGSATQRTSQLRRSTRAPPPLPASTLLQDQSASASQRWGRRGPLDDATRVVRGQQSEKKRKRDVEWDVEGDLEEVGGHQYHHRRHRDWHQQQKEEKKRDVETGGEVCVVAGNDRDDDNNNNNNNNDHDDMRRDERWCDLWGDEDVEEDSLDLGERREASGEDRYRDPVEAVEAARDDFGGGRDDETDRDAYDDHDEGEHGEEEAEVEEEIKVEVPGVDESTLTAQTRWGSGRRSLPDRNRNCSPNPRTVHPSRGGLTVADAASMARDLPSWPIRRTIRGDEMGPRAGMSPPHPGEQEASEVSSEGPGAGGAEELKSGSLSEYGSDKNKDKDEDEDHEVEMGGTLTDEWWEDGDGWGFGKDDDEDEDDEDHEENNEDQNKIPEVVEVSRKGGVDAFSILRARMRKGNGGVKKKRGRAPPTEHRGGEGRNGKKPQPKRGGPHQGLISTFFQ